MSLPFGKEIVISSFDDKARPGILSIKTLKEVICQAHPLSFY
jgi:hypothetical protein